MADAKNPSESKSPHFPAWQLEYESALRETDTRRLFKCVEIAEPAVLNRLEAISADSDHHAEREAIDDALAVLNLIKKRPLRLSSIGCRPLIRLVASSDRKAENRALGRSRYGHDFQIVSPVGCGQAGVSVLSV